MRRRLNATARRALLALDAGQVVNIYLWTLPSVIDQLMRARCISEVVDTPAEHAHYKTYGKALRYVLTERGKWRAAQIRKAHPPKPTPRLLRQAAKRFNFSDCIEPMRRWSYSYNEIAQASRDTAAARKIGAISYDPGFSPMMIHYHPDDVAATMRMAHHFAKLEAVDAIVNGFDRAFDRAHSGELLTGGPVYNRKTTPITGLAAWLDYLTGLLADRLNLGIPPQILSGCTVPPTDTPDGHRLVPPIWACVRCGWEGPEVHPCPAPPAGIFALLAAGDGCCPGPGLCDDEGCSTCTDPSS